MSEEAYRRKTHWRCIWLDKCWMWFNYSIECVCLIGHHVSLDAVCGCGQSHLMVCMCVIGYHVSWGAVCDCGQSHLTVCVWACVYTHVCVVEHPRSTVAGYGRCYRNCRLYITLLKTACCLWSGGPRERESLFRIFCFFHPSWQDTTFFFSFLFT